MLLRLELNNLQGSQPQEHGWGSDVTLSVLNGQHMARYQVPRTLVQLSNETTLYAQYGREIQNTFCIIVFEAKSGDGSALCIMGALTAAFLTEKNFITLLS